MKKKQYEKPSVEVVVLNQKPTLLQASNNLNDYNWNDQEE
jgi:hypothetical protein